MLKDGFLINKISKPLSSAEIDLIKDRALKYNPEPITESDIVLIETSFGLLKAKLFNDIAPKHCLNFKKLANSGFYDETTFHRVIPNFMIQEEIYFLVIVIGQMMVQVVQAGQLMKSLMIINICEALYQWSDQEILILQEVNFLFV